MSPEPESHESATAEPKSPSLTMAKARSAARAKLDKSADYRRGRERTDGLPPLSELELSPSEIEDEVVTVAEGAKLIGTSWQALYQLALRGGIPSYQHEGRRVLLISDLAESPGARRQLAREAEAQHDEAMAHYRAVDPIPAWMVPPGTPPPAPCPSTCRLCRREG